MTQIWVRPAEDVREIQALRVDGATRIKVLSHARPAPVHVPCCTYLEFMLDQAGLYMTKQAETKKRRTDDTGP